MSKIKAFFQDKVIWITGAGSGIGQALASALAACDVKLVLSGRDSNKLKVTAKLLQLTDDKVMLLPFDVTDYQMVPTMVGKVIERFGYIDILINNSGRSCRGLAVDTKLSVDFDLMAVNYFGAVALIKAVLPFMLERRCGQIVAMSSVSGKVGTPLRTAYVAAKHALQGFCNALRAEVAAYNIDVLVVCPGYVKTELSLSAATVDGNNYNKMDDNQVQGVPAQLVAEKTLTALMVGKHEIYVGGREIWAVYLARWWPKKMAAILAKLAKKRSEENAG